MTNEEKLLLAFMRADNISVNGKVVFLENWISEHGPLSDEIGEQVKQLLEVENDIDI